MNEIDELLETIKNSVTRLRNSIEIEEAEMLQLKTKGLIYAGTWYKAGKYLYLVHPGKDGRERQREYIGADEEKIAAALAGIERGQKYLRCEARKTRLEMQLRNIAYHLRNGEREAKRQ